MQTHDYFTRLVALNEVGPNMGQLDKDDDDDDGDQSSNVVWYECRGCLMEYDNDDEATECCPPREVFRCSVCDKKHDKKEEAKDCCPKPTAATGCAPMRCPICLQHAESYEEAADCCLHTNPALVWDWRDRIVASLNSGASWSESLQSVVKH